MRKSLLTFLGEALDQYRAQQVEGGPRPAPSTGPGRRPWSRLASTGLALLVVAALLLSSRGGALALYGLASPSPSIATIPYQGRLASASGIPFTGQQSMEFRLYAVPTGGTPAWTEYWTGGNSVSVSDGLFSVLLGSLTTNPSLASVVQANTQLWLGITIGTDTEMTPRVQLGSAAYSMQALTVPDASIDTIKLVDQSVTNSKLADASVSGPKLIDQSVTTAKLIDFGVSPSKLMTGSVSTDKIADSAVTARKMKTASYVSSASDDVLLTLFNTWVPLSPLTITVPALDLPVATKALVMFQARCSANVAMAITFHLLVDGSVVQYTDAWPTANQMLIFPMSDVITLSANTSHTISIKWRTVLAEGTARCADRRLQVILLGQ